MSDSGFLAPGWCSGRRRVNGLSLHVVEAGPETGPLLVLLHGFPEFWWAWRHQITPLAEAGFHVVVPDLRGYNLSDAPRGIGSYHLDLLVADVLALADGFGTDRFDLVGHDWGGVIGIGFRRRWHDHDAWFCSELIAAAFADAGEPLVRVDAWRITPRDLYLPVREVPV